MFGQRLIPRPLNPRKISPSVRRKGRAWLAGLRVRRQISTLKIPTSSGTGRNQKKLGRVNQRSATYCQPSGVQTLTTAITTISASSTWRVSSRMRCCSAPSLFMMSQVVPSSV